MTLSISIVAAFLLALALWLIFSVKKTKKRPRYTTDEQRKSFWDEEGFLSDIKELPKIETQALNINKYRKKKTPVKKRKVVLKKEKPENKTFDLNQAVLASEIIQKKSKDESKKG